MLVQINIDFYRKYNTTQMLSKLPFFCTKFIFQVFFKHKDIDLNQNLWQVKLIGVYWFLKRILIQMNFGKWFHVVCLFVSEDIKIIQRVAWDALYFQNPHIWPSGQWFLWYGIDLVKMHHFFKIVFTTSKHRNDK